MKTCDCNWWFMVILLYFVCFHVWFLRRFFFNQLQATALTFCTEPMVKWYQMYSDVCITGWAPAKSYVHRFFKSFWRAVIVIDSIHPRSLRKLLTSVLTSEIIDICWHARTAKKNGSLSRTSLHNQALDVLLLPSRIRRVMMSLMFLI